MVLPRTYRGSSITNCLFGVGLGGTGFFRTKVRSCSMRTNTTHFEGYVSGNTTRSASSPSCGIGTYRTHQEKTSGGTIGSGETTELGDGRSGSSPSC